MEKPSENVENIRKSVAFAWKTTAFAMENTRERKAASHEQRQTLEKYGFVKEGTKRNIVVYAVEKLWRKNFCMWENMWKVLQSA